MTFGGRFLRTLATYRDPSQVILKDDDGYMGPIRMPFPLLLDCWAMLELRQFRDASRNESLRLKFFFQIVLDRSRSDDVPTEVWTHLPQITRK